MAIVSISFHRFEGVFARTWAFSQMLWARFALARMKEISFFKLFGSGTGEGFTPVPNLGVYAILAVWPDAETARRGVAEGTVFRRYRAHATENATVFMTPASSRGLWDRHNPFPVTNPDPASLPGIAVITRATLKKRHVLRFWRQQPDVSATVRTEEALQFKIGLGEVPWFQQVTFSVWRDSAAMQAFAYRSSSHGEAIQRVRHNGWFKEELYARFRVLAFDGQWEGGDPLEAHRAIEPHMA
jgi:spheroidene monooxygenase